MRLSFLFDLFITLLHWFFFMVSLLTLTVLFPFLLLFSFFSRTRDSFFQGVIHFFLRAFLFNVQITIPRLSFDIPERKQIKNLRSSFLISNHLSWLDPLLLLSLNRKCVAIVKPKYFNLPVMGWIMRLAGYLPSFSPEASDSKAIKSFATIKERMEKGLNVLVFPEGTRSLTGKTGRFKKGVFSMAEKFEKSIAVLKLENIQILFPRHRFVANTWGKNTVRVSFIELINPVHAQESRKKAQSFYEKEEIQ